MSSESIQKRYFYKIWSNLIGYLLNLLIMGLIPKSLGVKDFGYFNYSTNFFSKIINFLDFKVTTFVFTKHAQNHTDRNLIKFYEIYSISIVLLLILFAFIIPITHLNFLLFPNQSIHTIILAGFYSALLYVQEMFINLMDARGLTLQLEKIRIKVRVINTFVIIFIFYFNILNITTLFFSYFILFFSYSISLFLVLKVDGLILFKNILLPKDLLLKYSKLFLKYTSPLILYMVISLIQEIADRWLLQYFNGSFEQGIYSFSFGITNLCFLFVSPMFPLFTRELSIFSEKLDIDSMSRLFRKYVPILFSFTAFFTSFLFFHTETVINLIAGKEYLSSSLSMKILSFYPLIAVYSMLNGSVIYANSKTKIFLKVALITSPIGVAFTYLLTSKGAIGYNLGAAGLALKIVIFEFISVLIILYINAKFLSLKYFRFLIHFISTIIFFITISFISKIIITNVFYILTNNLLISIISGLLYTIIIISSIFLFPIILGIKKEDLLSLKKIFLKKTS